MALFSRRAFSSVRSALSVNNAFSPVNLITGTRVQCRSVSNDNPTDGSDVRFPHSKNGRVSFVNTLGDQSKNPFNPNLYPEEITYGDPLEGLTPVQEKIYKEVVTKVNGQIAERNYGRLFAVIAIGGKQFRLTEGDIIMLERTQPLGIGEKIKFEKVLAVGSADFTLLGRPMLDRDLVDIDATVIEKSLSYPTVKFVHVKPISLRRRRFFRTAETMLRINRISFKRQLNQSPNPEDVVHTVH